MLSDLKWLTPCHSALSGFGNHSAWLKWLFLWLLIWLKQRRNVKISLGSAFDETLQARLLNKWLKLDTGPFDPDRWPKFKNALMILTPSIIVVIHHPNHRVL